MLFPARLTILWWEFILCQVNSICFLISSVLNSKHLIEKDSAAGGHEQEDQLHLAAQQEGDGECDLCHCFLWLQSPQKFQKTANCNFLQLMQETILQVLTLLVEGETGCPCHPPARWLDRAGTNPHIWCQPPEPSTEPLAQHSHANS